MFLSGLKSSLVALALPAAVASAAWFPVASEPLRLVAWGTLLLLCSGIVRALPLRVRFRSDSPR
jgi:hypothetical protein